MSNFVWSSEDRSYALERDGARITLHVDDAPVLVATAAQLDALVRHIGAVVHGRPLRSGLPWSHEEDDGLASAYLGGASIRDLAARFERSKGAITARLVNLGLADDEGGWRAFAKRSTG